MNEQRSSPDLSAATKNIRHKRSIWPITIAILCLIYAVVDLREAGKNFSEEFKKQIDNVDPNTRVGRMNLRVNYEVRRLQGIDTAGLAGSFGMFVDTHDCPFIVRCEVIDTAPKGASLAERLKHAADTPPPRSLIGQIWHMISAAPRAVIFTAEQVAKAGYWSIAMFLSCTIFWFALLFRMAKRDTPVIGVLMLIGAPLGIGLMVMFAQWLCEAALNSLGIAGCFLAVAFMAVVHGTALAVLVGWNHVSKSPREMAEGLERLRGV